MGNKEFKNSQEAAMENLIGQYLNARSRANVSGSATGTHLDHDSLAAFTEGNLSEREAKPIVSHLVDCSFCLHVTAELVRLDMAFAESPAAAPIAETAEPSRVSEVLSGLLSKIFGTNDGAVFAHNEKDEEEKKSSEDEDSEENKGN